MVAYSFKARFVPHIMVGLGMDVRNSNPIVSGWHGSVVLSATAKPKRQTIRAVGKRRHAEPGQDVSLYYGQRTKQCQLIGMGRCVLQSPIMLNMTERCIGDFVDCPAVGVLQRAEHLDQFAQMDGFIDWMELRSFWASNHPNVSRFSGVLIRWEPLV